MDGVGAGFQPGDVQRREALVGQADALRLLVGRADQHDDAVIGVGQGLGRGPADGFEALARLDRDRGGRPHDHAGVLFQPDADAFGERGIHVAGGRQRKNPFFRRPGRAGDQQPQRDHRKFLHGIFLRLNVDVYRPKRRVAQPDLERKNPAA